MVDCYYSYLYIFYTGNYLLLSDSEIYFLLFISLQHKEITS